MSTVSVEARINRHRQKRRYMVMRQLLELKQIIIENITLNVLAPNLLKHPAHFRRSVFPMMSFKWNRGVELVFYSAWMDLPDRKMHANIEQCWEYPAQ